MKTNNDNLSKGINNLNKTFDNLKKPYQSVLKYVLCVAIPLFTLFILLNYFIGFGLSDDSIAVTFIGIVSAFIVVSNYMQVKDIEKNFNKTINNIENKIITTARIHAENICNSAMSDEHFQLANVYCSLPDNQWSAIYHFNKSIVYCSKTTPLDINKIDRSFDNMLASFNDDNVKISFPIEYYQNDINEYEAALYKIEHECISQHIKVAITFWNKIKEYNKKKY